MSTSEKQTLILQLLYYDKCRVHFLVSYYNRFKNKTFLDTEFSSAVLQTNETFICRNKKAYRSIFACQDFHLT